KKAPPLTVRDEAEKKLRGTTRIFAFVQCTRANTLLPDNGGVPFLPTAKRVQQNRSKVNFRILPFLQALSAKGLFSVAQGGCAYSLCHRVSMLLYNTSPRFAS